MYKRYKILKDLPGAKAGTIFEQGKIEGVARYCVVKDNNIRTCPVLTIGQVEDNPDWFVSVNEEPTPEKLIEEILMELDDSGSPKYSLSVIAENLIEYINKINELVKAVNKLNKL